MYHQTVTSINIQTEDFIQYTEWLKGWAKIEK